MSISRAKKRGAALVAVAAGTALLLGFLAPSAGGLEAPIGDVTIDPDPVAAGADLTITPDDDLCAVTFTRGASAAGVPAATELQWEIADDEAQVVDDGSQGVGPSGDWQVDTSAPIDPGTYTFSAQCVGVRATLTDAAAPTGDSFVVAQFEGDFMVSGAGPPEFGAELDKAAGAPGDDIELTAFACSGTSGAAALLPVGEPPASPDDVDEDVLQQYDVIGGFFGGVVPVPTGTPAGTYQVVVFCMEGEQVADVAVLGYTVTAAAAPVTAAPRFTG